MQQLPHAQQVSPPTHGSAGMSNTDKAIVEWSSMFNALASTWRYAYNPSGDPLLLGLPQLLRAWAKEQRRSYQEGTLSEEKLSLLSSIQFPLHCNNHLQTDHPVAGAAAGGSGGVAAGASGGNAVGVGAGPAYHSHHHRNSAGAATYRPHQSSSSSSATSYNASDGTSSAAAAGPNGMYVVRTASSHSLPNMTGVYTTQANASRRLSAPSVLNMANEDPRSHRIYDAFNVQQQTQQQPPQAHYDQYAAVLQDQYQRKHGELYRNIKTTGLSLQHVCARSAAVEDARYAAAKVYHVPSSSPPSLSGNNATSSSILASGNNSSMHSCSSLTTSVSVMEDVRQSNDQQLSHEHQNQPVPSEKRSGINRSVSATSSFSYEGDSEAVNKIGDDKVKMAKMMMAKRGSYKSGCSTMKRAKHSLKIGGPPLSSSLSADDSSTSASTANIASSSTREKTGRWSPEEHRLFLEGMRTFGKKWTKIASFIGTRTAMQVRTHAQKYFQKADRVKQDGMENLAAASSDLIVVDVRIATVDKKKDSSSRKSVAPLNMSGKKSFNLVGRKNKSTSCGSFSSGDETMGTFDDREQQYSSDTEEVANLLAGMSKKLTAWH